MKPCTPHDTFRLFVNLKAIEREREIARSKKQRLFALVEFDGSERGGVARGVKRSVEDVQRG